MEYGLASGVDPNTHDLMRFVVKHAGFIQSRYACTFPHVCMYVHMHACAIVSYMIYMYVRFISDIYSDTIE